MTGTDIRIAAFPIKEKALPYELHCWPTIQGRGEFVRLAMEEVGADYVDVARGDDDAGGIGPMLFRLSDPEEPRPPFAPPYLRDGEVIIGQTAAILLYLGPRLGLVGASAADPGSGCTRSSSRSPTR